MALRTAAMYFHFSTQTNHDAYIKAVISPPKSRYRLAYLRAFMDSESA